MLNSECSFVYAPSLKYLAEDV